MNYVDVDELIEAYDLYGPSAIDSVVCRELLSEGVDYLKQYEEARSLAAYLSNCVKEMMPERSDSPKNNWKFKETVNAAFKSHGLASVLADRAIKQIKQVDPNSEKINQLIRMSVNHRVQKDRLRDVAEWFDIKLDDTKLTGKVTA